MIYVFFLLFFNVDFENNFYLMEPPIHNKMYSKEVSHYKYHRTFLWFGVHSRNVDDLYLETKEFQILYQQLIAIWNIINNVITFGVAIISQITQQPTILHNNNL